MPGVLDTVLWERDGGLYSGIILNIRGELAEIITPHRGSPLVRVADLQVIVPREQWGEEALRNHLWVVYGIRA